jgi:hypothetical protein
MSSLNDAIRTQTPLLVTKLLDPNYIDHVKTSI